MMRSGLLLLLISSFASVGHAQARRLMPDRASDMRTFGRDSVVLTIPVGTAVLRVLAERGANSPTTGRYLVLRDARPVALAAAQELVAGAPTVALASGGDPGVVILSTYTGGQGIPAFHLKLLVITDDATSAFTLSSETVGEVPGDVVIALSRLGPGQFTATLWGGLKVTYRSGRLEVSPAG